MEDSYANYTIDPEALRQGLEVLGLIASGITVVVAVCNPVGISVAVVAGVCTALGVSCSSLSAVSYLSEGNVKDALIEGGMEAAGLGAMKIVKFGLMKTGATALQIRENSILLEKMKLADETKEYVLGNENGEAPKIVLGQKVIATISNCVSQLPTNS